jgi:hypothetical protein
MDRRSKDSLLEPSRCNVLARFHDPEQARDVVERLEEHGVDALKISLVGPAVEEAAATTGRATTREVDRRSVRRISRRLFVAGAIGTFAGALLAFWIGVGLGLSGSRIGVTVGLAALVGGIIGVLAGGAYALPVTEDWSITFQSTGDDRIIVAVRSEDESDYGRANEVLEANEPDKISRFVRRGRTLHAA